MELGYGSTSTEYGYLKSVIESLVGTGGGGNYGIFIANIPQHNQGRIDIEDTEPPNTNGVVLDDFNESVVIENEGTYNIQYRIQFVNGENIGEAYIHLERGVNGEFTPIANSSSVYTITPSVVVGEDGPLSSAVGNFIVNCNAGDEIALVWASANQDISISHDAVADPANPSVILTVQEVTGRGPRGPPGPAGGPQGPEGPRGPAGPQGPGNMDWINTYLINAPPAITFLPAELRSTIVYIPWTNYNQINAGFMGYLPVATSFIATINNNNATTTGNVVVASPYNLDAKQAANLPANGLSGVVLYQTAGVNGVQNVRFPNETFDRRSYRIFGVTLNNEGNTIIATYLNFFNGNNQVTLTFNGYTQSGAPSVVRTVVLTILTNQTATLTYVAPEFVDASNTGSTLTILRYQIIYSTTGSTVRNGGPIAQEDRTVNLGGNVLTYAANGLFPDSLYTFNIRAENSANLFSQFVAAVPRNTLPLPANNLGDLVVPIRYFNHPNIYRIGTQQNAITTLVNNITNWDLTITAPIQNVNTRGNLALLQGTIMTLSATINNGAGPAVNFGSFGSDLPGAITVNNITITPTRIVDSYATSADQFQGFYQNATATLSIGAGAFVASGSVYTFQVTDSGILAPGVNTTSLTYYYDGTYNNNTVPTGILAYNITTPNQTFVSGVNVMGGIGTTIQYTATLTNMGRYFYRFPYFTMTSNANLFSATSPGLGVITNGYSNVTQEFGNTITLAGGGATITTNSFATLYTFVISITGASAFNAVGPDVTNNVTNNTGNIGVVIDGPSFNLITNVIPTQIPTMTNTTIGCRCYSAPAPVLEHPAVAAGTPPFTNGGQSYSERLYNQTWNISSVTGAAGLDATAEIMVANGRFTTPRGVSPNPYKNYRIYFGNTTGVDYSEISNIGYRYATFVWRVPESGGLNYSKLNIVLNGITGGGALNINGENGVVSIGGKPLRIFYRFENSGNLTPADTGRQNFTTVWADGNSVTPIGGNFTSTTYFLGTYNDVKWGLIGAPGTDQTRTFLNFNVSMPPLIVGTGITEYLYCRIGLPMDENIAYSHVSALLTTT